MTEELSKIDEDALKLALDLCLGDPDGPERIKDKVVEEDWFDAAWSAAYHLQCKNLSLKPWESPPMCAETKRGSLPEDANALRLLHRMRELGISEFHPDPVAAIIVAAKSPS
jgi:hypothetical protein